MDEANNDDEQYAIYLCLQLTHPIELTYTYKLITYNKHNNNIPVFHLRALRFRCR